MIEKVLVSVCDIGSNSVRMNIIELEKDKKQTKIIERYRSMLGLAGYIDNGLLTNDGKGKLHTILREYLAKANSVPVDYFYVFGTEALRNIRQSLGIDIEIISGLDEAKYDNYAVIEEFSNKVRYPYYVIDMGGGSIEINLNTKNSSIYSSLPLGSLVLSKTFAKDPMNIDTVDFDGLKEYILSVLETNSIERNISKTVYIIGGTARNAGKICLEEKGEKYKDLKDKKYTIFELDDLSYMISHDNNYLNEVVTKYCNDRRPSILCGIYALNIILKYYGIEEIIICNGGVREGYVSKIKENIFDQ